MKINKKFEVETRAAQESVVAVSKQANVVPGDGEAAARLVEQYNIVMKLETSCFRERVRFGLALIEWENYLGGGAGRGHGGEGLKGWLETHCPEIAYATAMEYKTYARQAVALNGGGKRVVAALLGEATVMQPDGEVVEVEAETIEKCEKFFADVDSRRKLQQAWFDFIGKAERSSAIKAGDRVMKKLSKSEEAKIIWTGVMNVLDKSAVLDSVPLLSGQVAEVCFERVTALRDALKARLAEEE